MGLGTEVDVLDSITDEADDEASSTASARTAAAARIAAAPATKRIVVGGVLVLLSHRVERVEGQQGGKNQVVGSRQKDEEEDNVDEAIELRQI